MKHKFTRIEAALIVMIFILMGRYTYTGYEVTPEQEPEQEPRASATDTVTL